MRKSISLLLSVIILVLCCLSGTHCEPSFDNRASREMVSIAAVDHVAHGSQQGDDSQDLHVCHFGHACHCSFLGQQEASISFSLSNNPLLGGYNFSHENPAFDVLIKPPIA